MKIRLVGGVVGRFAAALGLVALATGIGKAVGADLTIAALVLLVAVLLASLFGLLPGVLAAVSGFLCLDWFFTPPVHSFNFENSDDLTAGVVFVLSALVIGWVVTRLAELRRTAEQRALEAQIRLDLTNRLAGGERTDSIAASAAEAIVGLFRLTACTVRLGGVTGTARGPGDNGRAATERVRAGEALVEFRGPERSLDPGDHAVLEALVVALASAYDHAQLEHETREARVAIQVGHSRAGLLSAVSHNLRTPLASIKAAASTLRSPDAHLEASDRRELLDTIVDETSRLERLVTKTLDLSRIRAGGLDPDRLEVDLGDLAAAAIRRLRPLVRGHIVRLTVDPAVPALRLDVTMMEEVFLNLLENALRFAPPGSEILVSVANDLADVDVRVVDHGPGVPVEIREKVFEEFVRGDGRPDTTGTGLGLAIVRALVAAHGGTVRVEDTPGGGATFVVRIPRSSSS